MLDLRTCGWYVGDLAKDGDRAGSSQKVSPPGSMLTVGEELTGMCTRFWPGPDVVGAGRFNGGVEIVLLGGGEKNVNGKSWSAKYGMGAEGVWGKSNAGAATEGTVGTAILTAAGAGGDSSLSRRSRASGCQ